MKISLITKLVLLIFPVTLFFVGCGTPAYTVPDNVPLNIEDIDGSTDVAVDSSFLYSFFQAVDQSTVTTSTFFIVSNGQADISAMTKSRFDATACNSANALDATVSCQFSQFCILYPTGDLEYEMNYSICLSSDINYLNGTPFEGFMVQFSTASSEPEPEPEPEPESVPPSATIKLLRLDSTEMDLIDIPIPRAVTIKASFDEALGDEERTAVEDGFVLKQGDTELDKSFAWSDDSTSVTVTPDRWFGYGTAYTTGISSTAASGADENEFTTTTWGDINGDGYADSIVGAFRANVDTGDAYIFLGGASGMSDCDLSGSCTADKSWPG